MDLKWIDVIRATGLNIDVNKANWYREWFIEYFQYEGEGGNRKYDESAIGVLKFIATLYKQGEKRNKVRKALEEKYGTPANIVVTNNQETTNLQTETTVELLGLMKNFCDRIDERFDELETNMVEKLKAEIKVLEVEAKELRQEVKAGNENHDKILMEHIRLHQQQIEQQKQQTNKGFKKIFNIFRKGV